MVGQVAPSRGERQVGSNKLWAGHLVRRPLLTESSLSRLGGPYTAHSLEPMQRLGHLGEPVATLSRWTPGHLTVCTSSAVIAPCGDARTGRASARPHPCSLHASLSSHHPVPETSSHSGWKLVTCEQPEVKLSLLVFISDGTEILPIFAHSWAHGEFRSRVTVRMVSACDVSFMAVSVCSPAFTETSGCSDAGTGYHDPQAS